MKNYSHFMILSDSFFQEFDILLKEIEKNYVSERNLVKIKGNKFAMIGNTYLITYPNLKRLNLFKKNYNNYGVILIAYILKHIGEENNNIHIALFLLKIFFIIKYYR